MRVTPPTHQLPSRQDNAAHNASVHFNEVFGPPEMLGNLASFLDAHGASQLMCAARMDDGRKQLVLKSLPPRQQIAFMRRSPAIGPQLARTMTGAHPNERATQSAEYPISSSASALNAAWLAGRVPVNGRNGLNDRAQYIDDALDWLGQVPFTELSGQRELAGQVGKVLEGLVEALQRKSSRAQPGLIQPRHDRLMAFVRNYLRDAPVLDSAVLVDHLTDTNAPQLPTQADFRLLIDAARVKPKTDDVARSLAVGCARALGEGLVQDGGVQRAMLSQVRAALKSGVLKALPFGDVLAYVACAVAPGTGGCHIAPANVDQAMGLLTDLARSKGRSLDPESVCDAFDSMLLMTTVQDQRIRRGARNCLSGFGDRLVGSMARHFAKGGNIGPADVRERMLDTLAEAIRGGHCTPKARDKALPMLAKAMDPQQETPLASHELVTVRDIIDSALDTGPDLSVDAKGRMAILLPLAMSTSDESLKDWLLETSERLVHGDLGRHAGKSLANLAGVLCNHDMAGREESVVALMERLCSHPMSPDDKDAVLQRIERVQRDDVVSPQLDPDLLERLAGIADQLRGPGTPTVPAALASTPAGEVTASD
jgi:hypothetical protein